MNNPIKPNIIKHLKYLLSVNKKFNNRNEILHSFNTLYNLDYTYNAFKHLWRDDEYLASLLNKLVAIEEIEYNPYQPIIQGHTVESQQINASNVYEEILQKYESNVEKERKRKNQKVSFNEPVIAIVHMADFHVGPFMNIKRLFDETKCIVETPGMYINFNGDIADFFIGDWTLGINLQNKITPQEQFVIAKEWFKIAAPKLLAVTLGNHDQWAEKYIGYDPIYELVSENLKHVIYDTDENIFTADVQGEKYVIKSRHEWAGKSVTNITYGIEKSYKEVGHFDVGVGAHLHTSGVSREFLGHNGNTCVAVFCGSYKEFDSYPRSLGLATPNKSAAVCTIFDPSTNGRFWNVSDVFAASKIMKLLLR